MNPRMISITMKKKHVYMPSFEVSLKSSCVIWAFSSKGNWRQVWGKWKDWKENYNTATQNNNWHELNIIRWRSIRVPETVLFFDLRFSSVMPVRFPTSGWESLCLKVSSTDFTHQSVFTGLWEYYCICETSCIKPVAPEGTAQSLIDLLV